MATLVTWSWFFSWTVGPALGWLATAEIVRFSPSTWQTLLGVRLALGLLWPIVALIVFVLVGLRRPGLWTRSWAPLVAIGLTAIGVIPSLNTLNDFREGPREQIVTIVKRETVTSTASFSTPEKVPHYYFTFSDGHRFGVPYDLYRARARDERVRLRWLEHLDRFVDAEALP